MLLDSFRDRLVRLLERHGQTEQAVHADALLARYVGREEALLTALETMYATPNTVKTATPLLLLTPSPDATPPALRDTPAAPARQAVQSDTSPTPQPPVPRQVKAIDTAAQDTQAVPQHTDPKLVDTDCSTRLRLATFEPILRRLPALFHALGTSMMDGQPCLDRAACELMLRILAGHRGAADDASASHRAASGEDAEDFTTFARFAARARSLVSEMDDTDAATVLPRIQAFLDQCRAMKNMSCVRPSRGGTVAIAGNCHAKNDACDDELRFGFYAYRCVRPCVVYRWQRRWLVLNATMDVLNVYQPSSTDVELAVPFSHVVRCMRFSATSMPNAPPRCARNAVLWRLSEDSPPVEVLLCVEQGSLVCSLIDCFRRWQARGGVAVMTLKSRVGSAEHVTLGDVGRYCRGATNLVRRQDDCAESAEVTVWCCRGGYTRYLRMTWCFTCGVLHYRVIGDDSECAAKSHRQPASLFYQWDMRAVQSVAPLAHSPVESSQPSVRRSATLFSFVLHCADGVSIFCLVASAMERQYLMNRIAECRLRASFLPATQSKGDVRHVKVVPLPTILALPRRATHEDAAVLLDKDEPQLVGIVLCQTGSMYVGGSTLTDTPYDTAALQQELAGHSPRSAYEALCAEMECRPNTAVRVRLPDVTGAWESVTRLDLSATYVGPRGACVIVELCKRLSCLTRLDLTDNYITNEVVWHIVEMALHHPALTELELSCNEAVSWCGAMCLAELLLRNIRITYIGLRKTSVETAVQEGLFLQARKNAAATFALRGSACAVSQHPVAIFIRAMKRYFADVQDSQGTVSVEQIVDGYCERCRVLGSPGASRGAGAMDRHTVLQHVTRRLSTHVTQLSWDAFLVLVLLDYSVYNAGLVRRLQTAFLEFNVRSDVRDPFAEGVVEVRSFAAVYTRLCDQPPSSTHLAQLCELLALTSDMTVNWDEFLYIFHLRGPTVGVSPILSVTHTTLPARTPLPHY